MSYDRRGAELDVLMQTTNFDIAVPGALGVLIPPPLVPAWHDYPPKVSALYSARRDALDAILEPISDQGTDPKADDVNNRISALLDRWVLPFINTRSLAQPYTPWFNFIEREAGRETAFFQSLINLGVGEVRDGMLAIETGLNRMIAQLQYKWDTMSSSAKDLEKAEGDANEEMNRIIRTCQSDATDAWARYGSALDAFLAKANKFPDYVNDAVVAAAKAAGLPDVIADAIPKVSLVGKDYFAYGKEHGLPASQLAQANPELFRDPGMAVSEIIQKQFGPEFEALVTALVAYYKYVSPLVAGAYATQVAAIRSKFPNQGAVLVSFTQTRRDVDTFLKGSGLDQARQLYEDIQGRLSAWKDSLPSDGLRADADEWQLKAREAFQQRYERMANAFGVFVQSNQGRFTGSVTKEVENQLIFTDIWIDRQKGLLALGMDERLISWRDSVTKVDDLFAAININDALRDVPPDLTYSISYALNQYWTKLRGRIGTEVQAAKAILDSGHDLVNKDRIAADFDRRPLQALLSG